MIEVLYIIALSSACSVGFYIATQFEGSEQFDAMHQLGQQYPYDRPEGPMILWWVRWYGSRLLPFYWTKPIYSCLPCMGSVHSLYPTLLFLSSDFWYLWPVIALGTVGVNYLITLWWSR